MPVFHNQMAVINVGVFEQWLISKGLKERSIKNYFYYFNKFSYPKLNQESVSRFLSEAPHRNTIARAFIKNLQECMMRNSTELGIDPYYYKEIADVYFPGMTGRKQHRLINPLTEEQINLIESALETEEQKLMLLVCYQAGLRLGGLISIRVNSFNWDRWKENPEKMGEVRVIEKGDKEGIALIPSDLMKRIAVFINKDPTRYKGIDSKLFSLGPSSFQKYLHTAGVQTGITKKKENGDFLEETRIHPHKLRHSYAHNLLMKGVDIRYIKEALRHSSIQSTQIYTQLNTKELMDKLESVQ